MANSPKWTGNPLLLIGVVAVVVVAVMVGVFALDNEDVPAQPTVIEEDINAEPAGAGTLPEGEAAVGVTEPDEGEADENEEGITELVDDVNPAPEEIDSVPASDYVDSTGPDIEGETIADEQVADTVDEGVAETEILDEGEEPDLEPEPLGATTIEASQAGGANAEQDDERSDAALDEPLDQSATEEFLIDEETIGSEGAENVDTPGPQLSIDGGPVPDGRDAVTDLDPSACQDIVRDTAVGGDSAPFIPTPSGPDANTRGECLDDPEE